MTIFFSPEALAYYTDLVCADRARTVKYYDFLQVATNGNERRRKLIRQAGSGNVFIICLSQGHHNHTLHNRKIRKEEKKWQI
jgi:hypothetical protein